MARTSRRVVRRSQSEARKARKSWSPTSAAAAVANRFDVQRLAHVPGATRPQRRANEVAPDGVAVDLAARREAGVEVGRRLRHVDQRHVGGERRVEPAQEAVGRDVDPDLEGRHLAVGVDAGVGAAGAAHEHALAGHRLEGVLEGPLDGPLLDLPLPA